MGLLLLAGAALILFDRERILTALHQADWMVLPWAILFIILAYALVSVSYVILARIMGIRIKSGELAIIFFTTTVINRLVRSGGAAGYSLRYLMMKKHGVGMNDVLNSSFLHFLLGSMLMLGLLPPGMIYLLVFTPIPPEVAPSLIVLAVLGALLGFAAGSVVFSDRLRARLARLAIWLVKKILRRDVSEAVEQFSSHAAQAVAYLKQYPARFLMVMLLILAEMVANAIALGFCMRTFGPGLSPGGVAAVYILGTVAGVLTALPGGAGVQEGTMIGLTVAQGVGFEQSVLAAILFRIAQTFLPYLVSLPLYLHLLNTGDTSSESKNARI